MARYWETRPRLPLAAPSTPQSPSAASDDDRKDSFLSEFDRHRLTLLTEATDSEWQSELRRYLRDVPADVTRDTDIVAWWSVRQICLIHSQSVLTSIIGPREDLPHPCTHCPRHPPKPSVVRSMRTCFLRRQVNRYRPPRETWGRHL